MYQELRDGLDRDTGKKRSGLFMSERLKAQGLKEQVIAKWPADPNGDLSIEIFRKKGALNRVKGFFWPHRTVSVPIGMGQSLYEPMPVIIRGDERARIRKRTGEVLFTV
ncbi:MAG: hypothetical protein M1524_01505 [Patescibacteria group bacterium]|nr:hypothetical protein [Patescibacteria group bacterium]